MWVIVGVDPGETTGLTITLLCKGATPPAEGFHSHPLIDGYWLAVKWWGEATFAEVPRVLYSYMEEARRTALAHDLPLLRVAVVVEDFVITRVAMQANATWSSEVTGMAKLAAELAVPGHLFDKTQKSADMKSAVIKPKVLKEMGLVQRGDGISTHMADALGHAILFSARYRNGEQLRR